jgi:hypothetical protein
VVRRASVGKSRSHHGPVKRSVADLVRLIWAFAIAAANFCSKILCRKSPHEKAAQLAKQSISIKRIILVRWFERRRMGGSGSAAASPDDSHIAYGIARSIAKPR